MPNNIPLSQWKGSDATDKLRQTIEHFNAQSERQTKVMLRLTWVIAALTFIMAIGVGVQIYLALYPSR